MGRHFSEAKKAEVLGLLEAGETATSLAKKYKCSQFTIHTWKKKAGTIKGASIPALHSQVRQRIIEKMVQNGVDEKMSNGLLEALNAMKVAVIPSRAIDPSTGKAEPGFAEEVRDWRAFMDAVENIRKIIGLDAPTQSQVQVKMVMVNITEKLVALMGKYCPDERRAEMAIEAEAIFAEASGVS